jgi:hypothetical protein
MRSLAKQAKRKDRWRAQIQMQNEKSSKSGETVTK